MSEPFVGEIKMFAGNFAPQGWAFCDGQLLAVSQNDALFSLLGTIYGGDGRSTFGLPDMRGRVPIHHGLGPGLTPRTMGSRFGEEISTLTTNQLPSHSHQMYATSNNATETGPQDHAIATTSGAFIYGNNSATRPLSGNSVSATGGGQSHNNLMPTQCINFIIALLGIYPSRH